MNKKIPNQYTIRFKNNVDPRVLDFANKQTNFSDTILYLIEKEISSNGIRNLQTVIPLVRDLLNNIDEIVVDKDKNTSDIKENQNILIPTEYED